MGSRPVRRPSADPAGRTLSRSGRRGPDAPSGGDDTARFLLEEVGHARSFASTRTRRSGEGPGPSTHPRSGWAVQSRKRFRVERSSQAPRIRPLRRLPRPRRGWDGHRLPRGGPPDPPPRRRQGDVAEPDRPRAPGPVHEREPDPGLAQPPEHRPLLRDHPVARGAADDRHGVPQGRRLRRLRGDGRSPSSFRSWCRPRWASPT